MVRDDELEAHIQAVQLDHRRLWLDSAADLGLVAETLADALGWQPSHEQPLPDALELAQAAARRLQPPATAHRPQRSHRQPAYA